MAACVVLAAVLVARRAPVVAESPLVPAAPATSSPALMLPPSVLPQDTPAPAVELPASQHSTRAPLSTPRPSTPPSSRARPAASGERRRGATPVKGSSAAPPQPDALDAMNPALLER